MKYPLSLGSQANLGSFYNDTSMDLNGTLLCAAGAAYNIKGTTYSPQTDQLYDPRLEWLVKPVAFTGGVEDIDACFVGQNATGIIVSARGTLFSGTAYIDDWLNDFWSEPESWSYPFTQGTALPGQVHSGFYSAVQHVYAGVQSQVQSLLQASPAPVYVTGHSKGGGMAPLLAYLLNYNGIAVEQVMTFAAPKPGNTAFRAGYELIFPTNKHVRFENYGDLIPFLWPDDSVTDPILQELVSYMNSWGWPWTTFAQDLVQAETWDYQPVGEEAYINWTLWGGQSINTDPSQIASLQGPDLIANLVGQLAELHSPEFIFYQAHTIGCCVSGSTTPVIGYLSELCPGICPTQCPGNEVGPAAFRPENLNPPKNLMTPQSPNQPASPANDTNPISQTNDVLFTLWFPIDQLPIPPQVVPDITAILNGVKSAFFTNVTQGPNSLLTLLEGLTYPQELPFYKQLQQSTNPAIKQFISKPGGMGGLNLDEASQVLSFFFEGTVGPLSTEMAMVIRETYLSVIWDLPLAVPLTGIQEPVTFISDTALYAKINYPKIPPSWLTYDVGTQTINAKEGQIEYLVIGSGPAGATVAYELQKAGKKVVLIEQGPFVVWGSMNTMSYPRLMFRNDVVTTADNGVLVRSGQAMGGGSTVNIDLAFSPLESTIQARIANWIDQGFIDGKFYTQERLSAAYQWVRNAIATRAVTQSELNRDNRALWEGANAYGVDPSLYHLNRFNQNLSPSPVTQKRDAARQLILPAIEDVNNPLAVLPDVAVQELLFAPAGPDGSVQVTGASLLINTPWTEYGNTVVDPCKLNIPPGTQVSIAAQNVILSAGTIGSARILLHTAKTQSAVSNPRVGKGLIMHPSFPLIGVFDETINLLEGLDSATYLEAFGVTPGFIFETMSGLPAYGALLIPGSGVDVYNRITQFNQSAGFGVMLVDTPSDTNSVTLDESGAVVLSYTLSESDKQRFRVGIGIAIRMMFLAGAKEVIIPTNENVLGLENFNPMAGVSLTNIEQADLVEKNLQFVPNRTLLTSAHLQATNKLGLSADSSVASPRQRIWNWDNKAEIPNLYLMDSSMFPTSVGANPMQSLYTFAKIFSERLIKGIDTPSPYHFQSIQSDQPARGPVSSRA